MISRAEVRAIVQIVAEVCDRARMSVHAQDGGWLVEALVVNIQHRTIRIRLKLTPTGVIVAQVLQHSTQAATDDGFLLHRVAELRGLGDVIGWLSRARDELSPNADDDVASWIGKEGFLKAPYLQRLCWHTGWGLHEAPKGITLLNPGGAYVGRYEVTFVRPGDFECPIAQVGTIDGELVNPKTLVFVLNQAETVAERALAIYGITVDIDTWDGDPFQPPVEVSAHSEQELMEAIERVGMGRQPAVIELGSELVKELAFRSAEFRPNPKAAGTLYGTRIVMNTSLRFGSARMYFHV